MNERTLRPQVERLFSDIKKEGYDFANYNLLDFIEWLEKHIAMNKRLLLIPQELQPHEFGGWVSSEKAEFFFYEAQTPQVHQEHIILHEVSHWLCGHETRVIEPPLAKKMVEAWPKTQFPARDSIRMRSISREEEEEMEAEMLTYLIEAEVARCQKRTQDEQFATYLESMGLF